MKNYFRVLLFLAALLIVNGCSEKKPDKTAGGQEEVYLTAGLKVRPLTDVKFESTPERIARGKYLTNGGSHCFLCHSERDWNKPGAPPIESKKGAGAIMINEEGFRMVAPNITPDKETKVKENKDDPESNKKYEELKKQIEDMEN